MLNDMTDIYGTFGSGGGGGGGGTSFSDEDPVFVPAEVFYEDQEWYSGDFQSAVNALMSHATSRATAVSNYLNK